jgi:hypothetical protein
MTPPDYQDDTSIRDDERLFRRVHLTQLVKDEDTGLTRVSSSVFRDKELSVNIESALVTAGIPVEASLQNYNTHKLLFITAGAARRFDQAICRNPLPENPAHGLVYGSKSSKHIQNGLRTAAQWAIPATAPRYEDVEVERRLSSI